MAEAAASRVQADVFDGISNMVPLKRAGIAAPFVPPAAALYPADMKDKDGYWHAILLYVFTPGINTTLVAKAAAPKTYQDLLDPKWRGRMAWNPGSIAGAHGFVGNILMSMGEARGMEYLRALAVQRIVNIEASSRAILDQVIAGEYPIGLMMFNHHTVISAQKGAPSEWLAMEPVPVALDAVGILKAGPHPNAARLLVAFLTSEARDLAVYTPLIGRGSVVAAVVLSNTVGLVVDTVVFLQLAFHSLDFWQGQVIGKAWMTLLALLLIPFARRLLVPGRTTAAA